MEVCVQTVAAVAEAVAAVTAMVGMAAEARDSGAAAAVVAAEVAAGRRERVDVSGRDRRRRVGGRGGGDGPLRGGDGGSYLMAPLRRWSTGGAPLTAHT